MKRCLKNVRACPFFSTGAIARPGKSYVSIFAGQKSIRMICVADQLLPSLRSRSMNRPLITGLLVFASTNSSHHLFIGKKENNLQKFRSTVRDPKMVERSDQQLPVLDASEYTGGKVSPGDSANLPSTSEGRHEEYKMMPWAIIGPTTTCRSIQCYHGCWQTTRRRRWTSRILRRSEICRNRWAHSIRRGSSSSSRGE